MGLKIAEGDMYEFISHTWNPVKGKCNHDCEYCYMKKFGKRLNTLKFDEDECKTVLGTGKFIFVGSGTDLFAEDVPKEWIVKTLNLCHQANQNLFGDYNDYLFQSKNPKKIIDFLDHPVFEHSVVCTTIETNRDYRSHMGNTPRIEERVAAMEIITNQNIKTYVTIEPIMKFDLTELVEMIKRCKPEQVNIGAVTGDTVLPEPSANEIGKLIDELSKFTVVEQKKNLSRLF